MMEKSSNSKSQVEKYIASETHFIMCHQTSKIRRILSMHSNHQNAMKKILKEYGSATGVKRRCQTALSYGVVIRRCHTALSNDIVE